MAAETLALFAEVYDNETAKPHKVDITTTLRADDGTVAFKKTKVTLKVIRDGRETTITATLGALPEQPGDGGDEDPSSLSKSDALDGVEVGDLDAQARRQYNIPSHVQGALVTKVEPDSTAAEAGLREGDVVLEINRQPVRDADEAVKLSEKAIGSRVWLRIWSGSSGGGFRYFSVEEPKKK